MSLEVDSSIVLAGCSSAGDAVWPLGVSSGGGALSSGSMTGRPAPPVFAPVEFSAVWKAESCATFWRPSYGGTSGSAEVGWRVSSPFLPLPRLFPRRQTSQKDGRQDPSRLTRTGVSGPGGSPRRLRFLRHRCVVFVVHGCPFVIRQLRHSARRRNLRGREPTSLLNSSERGGQPEVNSAAFCKGY